MSRGGMSRGGGAFTWEMSDERSTSICLTMAAIAALASSACRIS